MNRHESDVLAAWRYQIEEFKDPVFVRKAPQVTATAFEQVKDMQNFSHRFAIKKEIPSDGRRGCPDIIGDAALNSATVDAGDVILGNGMAVKDPSALLAVQPADAASLQTISFIDCSGVT